MKKKLDIYIACSTKADVLFDQKKDIIDLCKELNNEYARKGIDIRTKAVGYDAPERRKEVFEDFINHNADIVVFLIDENIDNTQEEILKFELDTAIKRFKKNYRPVILIYLPSTTEEKLSDNLKKILEDNKLLAESVTNKDDLKECIRKKILLYVDCYDMYHKQQRSVRRRHFWYKILLALFIVSIPSVYYFYKYLNQSRVLITGGGSVKTYILNECGVDIVSENRKFWLYAPMPSENSWTLLTEEVIKKDEDRQFFTPICLSAESAPDSVFLGKMDSSVFKNTGIVVSVLLGYDPLIVLCRKTIIDSLNANGLTDTTIDCRVLDSIIISNPTISLFTTSLTSGTYGAYTKKCPHLPNGPKGDSITLKHDRIKLFKNIEEITDANIISKWGNYVILGSKNYLPHDSTKESKKLTVFDGNSAIFKPIYLYFMAYKKQDGVYAIPSEVISFFMRINRPLLLDKHTTEHGGSFCGVSWKEYIITNPPSYIHRMGVSQK